MVSRVNAIRLRVAAFLVLSICIALYIFSLSDLNIKTGLHSKDTNALSVSSEKDCKIHYENLPLVAKYERAEKKNYFFTSDSKVIQIPWNYNSSKTVNVQNIWVYNPSVIEVQNSQLFFSATIMWTYGLDCGNIQDAAPDVIFACLKSNYWKLTDGSTLLGFFNSETCMADVMPVQEYSGWTHGDSWGDTKMLFFIDSKLKPFLKIGSFRSHNIASRPIVLMTSLKIEYIYSEEWEDGSKSFLVMSMMHMAVVDLFRKSIRHIRAIFYDPIEDAVRLEIRQLPENANYENDLFKHSIDYGRELCSQRPASLPQFPLLTPEYMIANKHTRMWFKKELYLLRENRKEFLRKEAIGAVHEPFSPWATTHRRSGFKDKNWSPFLANDTLLWSYTISPHVICENDIDLRDHIDSELDCVLCIKKFSSDTTMLLSRQQAKLDILGFRNPGFHLNGVPAHKLKGKSFYLGIMHAICNMRSVFDGRGTEEWRNEYVHFFYKMQPVPPYAIFELSAPMMLSTGRGVGPWLDSEEQLMVAFVTGFQYDANPRKEGSELLISYGKGDMESRVLTMGVKEALALFA